MYAAVKHIHLTVMALSVLFFLYRYVLLVLASPKLHKKWVKVLPHIVDTLWLLSAIALCVLLQQYPFAEAWVTEKLLALVMYVFFVTFTLKIAKNNLMRAVGVLGALSWISFAGFVAVSKQAILF